MYHGQSAALTSREYFYIFVGGFAAKHEGSQDVADAVAYFAFGHAVDGVEHGQIVVQQLGLVLGVVTDFYLVADFQVSGEGDLTHDALDQGRLAFAIFADKGYFFSSPDGEVDVVKDHVVAVGFGYVFANDGEVAAAGAGRELEAKGGGVDFIDFDGNDFLQLLDAALHLYGFGGFIAEAFDEALDVGNFFLLVFVGANLAFASLGA